MFKPDSLVSIIIGPRFGDASHERLITTIKDTPYEGLPIRRATLSNTTFSVEVSD
jgi:hypothetical protein